jgi:ABC-type cobalamin transport system permease subunit
MRGRRRSRQSHVLAVQGVYYLTTGLAPFASRRWFERVTGPKTEWWLVQTVGAVVAVAGAGLTCAVARERATPEVVGMAAGWAASLAAIDVVYVGRRRIPPTYLLDAGVELAILTALLGPDPAAQAGS